MFKLAQPGRHHHCPTLAWLVIANLGFIFYAITVTWAQIPNPRTKFRQTRTGKWPSLGPQIPPNWLKLIVYGSFRPYLGGAIEFVNGSEGKPLRGLPQKNSTRFLCCGWIRCTYNGLLLWLRGFW